MSRTETVSVVVVNYGYAKFFCLYFFTSVILYGL